MKRVLLTLFVLASVLMAGCAVAAYEGYEQWHEQHKSRH